MPDYTEALARLAVGVGANVGHGQTVILNAKLGQEPLVRAVVAAAYDAGAFHVEVNYADPRSSWRGSSTRLRRRSARSCRGCASDLGGWPSCRAR